LLVLASLLPAAPALATHGGSHDPKPSAPACEWYGSVEHNENQPRTTDEFGNMQEHSERGNGWSGPSQDSICRGTVQYSYNQYETTPDGLWWRRQAEGTVSATYEAGWANYGPPGTFAARFEGDEPVTQETTDSSGAEPGTTQVPAGTQGGCVVPGANTAAKRARLQAVVITCSQIESSSSGETWTATIRMRRTKCDKTIDTDGDDLADCTEFSLQTEPHNPDTDGDGLGDGKEVLKHKTNPRDPDTDDGGIGDGEEVARGTRPLDGTDDFLNCRDVKTRFVATWNGVQVLRYSWDEITFCWGNGTVRVMSLGERHGVTVRKGFGGAFALFQEHILGQKFKYAGSKQASLERLSDTLLEAKGKGTFKFCQSIPLEGKLLQTGIKRVLDFVPDSIKRRLLDWSQRRIFRSGFIPGSLKNDIVRRGFDRVLDSYGGLSDRKKKLVKFLFDRVADGVGGKLVELVLGDGVCAKVWKPEIVARFHADGGYDTFDNSTRGLFTIVKNY
jgi:hypothetical protein